VTLLAPAGLWALAAVPAVLALHLWRRRMPTRRVAGLFLFAPRALAGREGPRRSRLLRSPSLWLELAAAALLALWLAEPALGVADPPPVVVVLDDSASMGASGVRARARAALAEFPGRARLLATGARPRRLADLEEWRPRRPAHDLLPALVLAEEWTGPAGRVVLLTDRIPERVPPRCEVVAVGAPRPNAALVDARRDEDSVFLAVRAHADAPMRATVAAGGETRALVLPPDRTVRVRLPDPAPDRPLTVRLGADALAIDNEWTLLPQPARVVPVACTWPPDRAGQLRVEDAFAALEGIAVRPPAAARLVLGPAPDPPAPDRWELRLAAGEGARTVFAAPFLLARPEPLLEGVSLSGVLWAAGPSDPPGDPLVIAGERVLLSRHGRRVHLNLDPARSTLAASSDWPVLLANLVELVRDDLPGPVERNVPVGGVLRYRRAAGAASAPLVAVDPDGRRRPGYGAGVVAWEAEVPGRWAVFAGDERVASYSVSFLDGRESDLTGASSGRRAAERAASEPVRASAEGERTALALLLLACVAADWWWLGGGASGRRRRR